MTQTLDDQINSLKGSFTQFVADNVDHNTATIDGHGTFHGMGIIASTITNTSNIINEIRIKRPEKLFKVEHLSNQNIIPIIPYDFPSQKRINSIALKPILELSYPYVLPNSLNTDIIWHSASITSTESKPRANWSGYMQNISHGKHSPKAKVTFLPIIDLNPSDYTCIYSTLLFIIEQSKKLNIETPSVTFDQPLWKKAVEIAVEKSLDIVVHLGGFHTLMSFLGSVGTLMEGSGLEKAFKNIYGDSSLASMLHGKAVSRGIRGHVLTESALMVKLIQYLLPNNKDNAIFMESNFSDNSIFSMNENDIEDIKNIQLEIESGNNVTVDSQVFQKLEMALENLKSVLSQHSKTARFWLQYMDYVNIIRTFIRPSRTGDWNLYFITLEKMLNLFAATVIAIMLHQLVYIHRS